MLFRTLGLVFMIFLKIKYLKGNSLQSMYLAKKMHELKDSILTESLNVYQLLARMTKYGKKKTFLEPVPCKSHCGKTSLSSLIIRANSVTDFVFLILLMTFSSFTVLTGDSIDSELIHLMNDLQLFHSTNDL